MKMVTSTNDASFWYLMLLFGGKREKGKISFSTVFSLPSEFFLRLSLSAFFGRMRNSLMHARWKLICLRGEQLLNTFQFAAESQISADSSSMFIKHFTSRREGFCDASCSSILNDDWRVWKNVQILKFTTQNGWNRNQSSFGSEIMLMLGVN
jgi:hypothetical protein